jgi:hypothetical protein
VGHSNESLAALPPGEPSLAVVEFTAALRDALNVMARRSHRMQADVTAAMNGAGLKIDANQMRRALLLLFEQGCVKDFVPLADGGLLVTVTQRPFPMPRSGPNWNWLEDN